MDSKDILQLIAECLPTSLCRCRFAQASKTTRRLVGNLPNALLSGEKHGLHTRYFESGELQYECDYKDGELHGLYRGYYKSGELSYEWNYKDGEKHGLCRAYYRSGRLYYESNYKDGQQV